MPGQLAGQPCDPAGHGREIITEEKLRVFTTTTVAVERVALRVVHAQVWRWVVETRRKPHSAVLGGAFKGKAGDGLLSRNLSIAVPSALQGLTAVFGMGTGVAPAR